MENEGSDIAERHGEGKGGFLCAIRDGVVLVSMVYSRQPQRHRATLLAGRVRAAVSMEVGEKSGGWPIKETN